MDGPDKRSCHQFNPPGFITEQADLLEVALQREWTKAISPNMMPDEKKAVSSLLGRAIKDDISFFFREAGKMSRRFRANESRPDRAWDPTLL